MTKIEQVKSTANSIVIAVFIINFMFQIVNGKDSRISDIGFVKLNLLEGKAVIRLYPFNKMGGSI